MYLFGSAVLVFGLGYYWISRDFRGSRQIAKLAVYGKLGAFGIAMIATLSGAVSLTGLADTLIDFTYGLLFAWTLRTHPALTA